MDGSGRRFARKVSIFTARVAVFGATLTTERLLA